MRTRTRARRSNPMQPSPAAPALVATSRTRAFTCDLSRTKTHVSWISTSGSRTASYLMQSCCGGHQESVAMCSCTISKTSAENNVQHEAIERTAFHSTPLHCTPHCLHSSLLIIILVVLLTSTLQLQLQTHTPRRATTSSAQTSSWSTRVRSGKTRNSRCTAS
jgi:hypothetical protein